MSRPCIDIDTNTMLATAENALNAMYSLLGRRERHTYEIESKKIVAELIIPDEAFREQDEEKVQVLISIYVIAEGAYQADKIIMRVKLFGSDIDDKPWNVGFKSYLQVTVEEATGKSGKDLFLKIGPNDIICRSRRDAVPSNGELSQIFEKCWEEIFNAFENSSVFQPDKGIGGSETP